MTLSDKGLKRVLKEIREHELGNEQGFSLVYDGNCLQKFYAILRNMDGSYEGGEYILEIKLPADYPFSPPVISCITPNGRFQTSVNICLSISHFHSESWSPLITLEKIILSVASIFYDNTISGVGSITSSEICKRQFANNSREYNLRHNSHVIGLEKGK